MSSEIFSGKFYSASLTMLVALFTLPICQAKEEGDTSEPEVWIKRNDYVVLTAEDTALQQFLENRDAKRSATYVLLDGNALCTDEILALDKFDWKQLSDDLKSATTSRKNDAVHIHTYFSRSARGNAQTLLWTLEGFARMQGGFASVKQVSTVGKGLWESIENSNWPRQISQANTSREDAVGNEYVQVYPVRTFLSRLYTDGADCVVSVQPKFSSEFGEGLPRSIRTSMSVFSRNVEFTSKEKVSFVFRYSPGNGDEAKRWFEATGAQEMAQVLGFGNWVVSTKFE